MASGDVEVDGAYFGGYVKPANHKANRRDLRKAENQTGKRQVVVVMRERGRPDAPLSSPVQSARAVATIAVNASLPARPSMPTKPPAMTACTLAS